MRMLGLLVLGLGLLAVTPSLNAESIGHLGESADGFGQMLNRIGDTLGVAQDAHAPEARRGKRTIYTLDWSTSRGSMRFTVREVQAGKGRVNFEYTGRFIGGSGRKPDRRARVTRLGTKCKSWSERPARCQFNFGDDDSSACGRKSKRFTLFLNRHLKSCLSIQGTLDYSEGELSVTPAR